MSSVTGKCLCGQITVSISEEVFNATNNIILCHCRNCQQTSGSVAALVMNIPESALTITGKPNTYEDNSTDSGTLLRRSFCGNCGSPIYAMKPTMPGIRFVRLGLFDNLPQPSAEIYCKRRPSWDKPIEGAKKFDAMPTA